MVTPVSSTASCSRAAAIASSSSAMPATTVATSSGWWMYASPDLRIWFRWAALASS